MSRVRGVSPEPSFGMSRKRRRTRLEMQGACLEEAVDRLILGGVTELTLRREHRAWQEVREQPGYKRDIVRAALRVLARALRRGLRGSTVAGIARTIECAAYRRGVEGFRQDARWRGAQRTIARAIGTMKRPVETPDWSELIRRFRALSNATYKAAAALMISSGQRFKTVLDARASALVWAHGKLHFIARFDKKKPLVVGRRFVITEPLFIKALRPFALDQATADEMERRALDHRDLPPLLPLPVEWPVARTRISATAVRRAVTRQLIRAGESADEVARFVGHSWRAQVCAYRTEPTPADMRYARVLRAQPP